MDSEDLLVSSQSIQYIDSEDVLNPTPQEETPLPDLTARKKAVKQNKAKALRRVKRLQPYIADPAYFQKVVDFWRLTFASTHDEVRDLIPEEVESLFLPFDFESLQRDEQERLMDLLIEENSPQNPLDAKIVREFRHLISEGGEDKSKEREFTYHGDQYAAVICDASDEAKVVIIRKFSLKKPTPKPYEPVLDSRYKGALLGYIRDDEMPNMPQWRYGGGDGWLLEAANGPDHPLDYWIALLLVGRELGEGRPFEIDGVKYFFLAYLDRKGVQNVLFLRDFTCRKCGGGITSYGWCTGGTCHHCKQQTAQLVQAHIQDPQYLEYVKLFTRLMVGYERGVAPDLETYKKLTEYLLKENSLANPLDEELGFEVAFAHISDDLVYQLGDLIWEGVKYRILAFGDIDDLRGIVFLLDAVDLPPAAPPDPSVQAQYLATQQQFLQLYEARDVVKQDLDAALHKEYPMGYYAGYRRVFYGDDEEEEPMPQHIQDLQRELKEREAVLTELAEELQARNTIATPVDELTANRISHVRHGHYHRSKDFQIQGVPYRVLAYGSDDGIHGQLFIKLSEKGGGN
jgi:hypothetical protein